MIYVKFLACMFVAAALPVLCAAFGLSLPVQSFSFIVSGALFMYAIMLMKIDLEVRLAVLESRSRHS